MLRAVGRGQTQQVGERPDIGHLVMLDIRDNRLVHPIDPRLMLDPEIGGRQQVVAERGGDVQDLALS